MTHSSIDALIPVYNSASTIRESLDSVLSQSVQDIAIHIVDDGSTDGTPDILAEMAQKDGRIHIHTKRNSGIVDALNYGLTFCTAPYVARIDGDDIAYPKRFEIQKIYLDQNPDCIAVGSQARHIDSMGQPTGSISNVAAPEKCDPFFLPAREPYIIHPFLMLRRANLVSVGGYRFAHHCEDTDLYWRLLNQGRLHNLPDILGDYRLHSNSISSSSLQNGRLMSVFSQIAAISEQRRRAGKTDIAFDKGLIDTSKNQNSFQTMVEACTTYLGLTDAEATYLKAAACAKLLELTSYRPYDLEPSDTKYIGTCLRDSDQIASRENRNIIRRQLTGTAANIFLKGQILSGYSLLTLSDIFPFVFRVLLRLALPNSIRLKLRRLTGNKGPAK